MDELFSMQFGDLTLSFSEGVGAADGFWLNNAEGEGMRIEENDQGFADIMKAYFEANF